MRERIIQVLSAVLELPESEISDQTSTKTVEGWDSVRHMKVMMALEEEFGLEFTDEEYLEMQSTKLIEFVIKKRVLEAPGV